MYQLLTGTVSENMRVVLYFLYFSCERHQKAVNFLKYFFSYRRIPQAPYLWTWKVFALESSKAGTFAIDNIILLGLNQALLCDVNHFT